MAWVTTKSGKRVNTDWFDDDANQKERQIKANKQEAEKKNSKAVDYHSFENQQDMAMELYKRTGINFNGHLKDVNKDTFARTCETLEDLENKYHINGVGPDDMQGYRLDVVVPADYEHTFEGEELENAFACARLNTVYLNSEHFSMNPEELDSAYATGTEGYRPFHPKGTTSRDIIVHEVAHHMMDRKVWEMCGHDTDKYFKIQKFLTDENEYDEVSESTMPEIKELFNRFNKVRKKYIGYLKKDPEAVDYLGSYLKPNTHLTFMANAETFGRYGICKYASTNYHELIAESFADFYANGKEAKQLSRMIVVEFLGIKEAK